MACTIASCAATGKIYTPETPPSGQGLIYVYRPSSIVGAIATWKLYANGFQELKLNNGGYAVYHAKPGSVTFTFAPSAKGSENANLDLITINVDPGEVYFLRLTHGSLWIDFQSVFRLELVDSKTGEAEIRNMKMSE
jgi:hypothetical protein